MSFFGNQQNQSTGTALFGTQQTTQSTNIFGNNNNKPGGLSGINANNISFGANNTSNGNNIFGNNNTSNAPNFGAINSSLNLTNKAPSFLGNNNNNPGNQTNIFAQINNPTQNNNNNNPQNQNNNIFGINSSNNNPNNQINTNFQQNNNNFNQNGPNQYLGINYQRERQDLEEYKQILTSVSNCSDPSQVENMFKDYLYNPIPKGIQPNEVNKYRPYSMGRNQQMIINDYNIWEEASKKNVDSNKYYPIQISSVDDLLNRYKNLEKGILQSIAKTVETQKSLEDLNKNIDNEMNNKISELKNCHVKLDKLQLGLSSKVAQYNYLLGTAKENISDTQLIKENIKKANDNINKNNMVDLSEKIKKISNEEMGGENKDYIKDMNKDKINYIMDAFVEIQNMMNVINTNNKKNLNLINGMQKEVERIMKKNEL